MDFADPMNFYGASSETDGIIGDEISFTSASGLGLDNRGDPMVIDAEVYVCHHIHVVPSATLTPTQYTTISTSPGAVLFCPHHAVPVNICSPALVQAADNFGSVPVHGFSPTPFGEEFSGPYPSIQPTTASHQHSDTYCTNSPTPSTPHAMTRQQYSGPLSDHSPMNASPGPYSTNSPRPLSHPSSLPASTAAHSHDSSPFRGHGGRGGRQPHARGNSFRGRSPKGRSPRGCTATDGQFPPDYQNHPQPPFGRGMPHFYKNSRRGHHPRHDKGPAYPSNNYPPGYENSGSDFSVPRIHRSMHPELSDYSRATLSCIPPRLTPPATRHSHQPSSEEQLPKHHLPETPNSDDSTYAAAMRLASFYSKGIFGEIEHRSKAKNTRSSQCTVDA